MDILRIQAQDTYAIRRIVKSNDHSNRLYRYDEDHDDQTFHLGGIVGRKIVGVASFYFMNNSDIEAPYQYRLRAMGTIPAYQKKGIGSALIKASIPIILQNQGHIVWCFSKESSISFYLKIGLKPVGNLFNFNDRGPHLLMYLDLVKTSITKHSYNGRSSL